MIKVKNGTEIHILRVQTSTATIKGLRTMVRDSFKSCPSAFCFSYTDEEGDQIDVATDDDLQAVFQLEKSNTVGKKNRMVKLELKADDIDFIQLPQYEPEMSQEHSFELLNSRENSQYEELNSSQELSSLEVLNDQLASLDEQKNIAGMGLNDQKAQEINIESVLKEIEGRLIQVEVEKCLGQLYEEVVKKEEEEILRLESEVKQKEEKKYQAEREKNEKLAQLVEQSLKKLMPSFLERLTQKTIENVKKTLNNEIQH